MYEPHMYAGGMTVGSTIRSDQALLLVQGQPVSPARLPAMAAHGTLPQLQTALGYPPQLEAPSAYGAPSHRE